MPVRKMLDELNDLHLDFLELGARVEVVVTDAVRAIHEPHPDGPAPIAAGTGSLSEQGHRIAERGGRIMLLYQPVASDFRQVAAVTRMTTELERIGSLALTITERSADLGALSFSVPEELSRLAESVFEMVRSARVAYERRASAFAPWVWRTNAEVTERATRVTRWLTETMKADPAAVEPGLSLFVVVQNLQRIADHAAGLAEAVVFLTEGRTVHFRSGDCGQLGSTVSVRRSS
jgi:phosphate transport system protein